jgi:hypothetical protein
MSIKTVLRKHGFQVVGRVALEQRSQDLFNHALHGQKFKIFLDDVGVDLHFLHNYLVVYRNDPMKTADSAERFMQGNITTDCNGFSYDIDSNIYVILYSRKVKTYHELLDAITKRYETNSGNARDYIDAVLKDVR